MLVVRGGSLALPSHIVITELSNHARTVWSERGMPGVVVWADFDGTASTLETLTHRAEIWQGFVHHTTSGRLEEDGLTLTRDGPMPILRGVVRLPNIRESTLERLVKCFEPGILNPCQSPSSFD